MSAFATESIFAECVGEALQHAGYDVFSEVPLMSRCVDIVAVHRESGEVLAIECKLRDWKRALRQAKSHSIACDLVSICVPMRTPSEALLQSCQEGGVGLLMMDAQVRTLERAVEPQPAERIWQPARGWLVDVLRQRGASC